MARENRYPEAERRNDARNREDNQEVRNKLRDIGNRIRTPVGTGLATVVGGVDKRINNRMSQAQSLIDSASEQGGFKAFSADQLSKEEVTKLLRSSDSEWQEIAKEYSRILYRTPEEVSEDASERAKQSLKDQAVVPKREAQGKGFTLKGVRQEKLNRRVNEYRRKAGLSEYHPKLNPGYGN